MQSDPAFEEFDETEETDGSSPTKKRTIVKSATPFPYVNLEEVAILAKAMSDRGGVPLTRDQVAQALNTNENSTFSLKIAAARLFEAISSADGKFSLTEIGYGLASDDDYVARTARRDAFSRVELYRKVYDHFRGKTLPPRNGIENVFISLGVSEKQAEKARQIFERSALFAGYLTQSKDRLVEPVIIGSANGPVQKKAPENSVDAVASSSIPPTNKPPILEMSGDPMNEELIHGLLVRLPKVGSAWDVADRVKWLRTLIANFNTVYEDVDIGDGKEWDISVTLRELD